MAESYTIQHIDELEHPWPNWILARKSLGITAFGMNVCELQPGESIPQHDETGRDQEEVFLTLTGSPTLVIDGDKVFAAADEAGIAIVGRPRAEQRG